MYKVAGNTVLAIPNEFIRIALIPPENEDDILWRSDGICSETNKWTYKLLQHLWIPSIYLEPEVRKKYDEILVLRNGGRSSDIIIPTLTVENGEIEYKMNILNCKGTGVIESRLKKKGKSTVEYRKGFAIRNSVISREEYSHERPYGGVTAEAALENEVPNEQVMLSNDLPHVLYAMVIRIPREIQREIDEYNANNIYQGNYSRAYFGSRWISGDLVQVKRFFTTNLRMRMKFYRDKSFYEIVENNPRLGWLEPENLALLLGRCDGKYEKFLNKMKTEGKFGDFLGHIRRNRTIDGLLVDGENLAFRSRIEHSNLIDMPKATERFIKIFSKKVFDKGPSEIHEIVGVYYDAKKKELTHKRSIDFMDSF